MPPSHQHPTDSSLPRLTTRDFEQDFPMLMATCVKYMRESLNAHFSKAGYGVTSEQWQLLTHLADQDGISQQELADRYDRSKVSTMALIRKLEKIGYINRQPHPSDKRANLVYLTEQGRQLQRSLSPLAKTHIVQMKHGISQGDIEHLKKTLRRISKNLSR